MLDNAATHSSITTNPSYCKDEHFVAQYFAISLGTVRRWRYLGQGPRYRKIGGLVRYSPVDLDTWLASRPTGGEVSPKEGK